MRVLVVPSWYPTAQEPLNGSFFREQALMIVVFPRCRTRGRPTP